MYRLTLDFVALIIWSVSGDEDDDDYDVMVMMVLMMMRMMSW